MQRVVGVNEQARPGALFCRVPNRHLETAASLMARVRHSLLAGVVSVCAIAAIHYLRGDNVDPPVLESAGGERGIEMDTVKSPFSTIHAATPGDQFLSGINATRTISFSADVAALVDAEKFAAAREKLLERASVAVENEDRAMLAQLLAELGEVSLAQTDVDAAELYLAEALDVFQQLGDEVSTAGVYMQFGRLHLLERERARLASDAYDALLIARWKISHNQFDQVEQQLRQIANTNLKLNRYGAAASAYETLFRGYAKTQQFERAEQAGFEAARLHAASGRVYEAEAILERMRNLGIAESAFEGFELELRQLTREFDESVNALAMARDQEQLYNQLLARGDVVQAWRFRQRAGHSQARASARAQYRRQPDVLVELYRSNSSMENARTSLQRAREVFIRYGLTSQVERSENLQAQIY